jgi:glycosyltransferase involved in cell wall biosynthesis
MPTIPRVSVVVPTRNRADLLRTCVEGIEQSAQGLSVELVIVDDGSDPPLVAGDIATGVPTRVLRLEGGGPAAARNAGARASRGCVVLFTDDDAVPDPSWIGAALAYLDEHPNSAGVAGLIRSVPWDPLYEQSLDAGSGHYWTCNIAYRKDVFDAVGGFRADVFTHAHAEDRDLALRAQDHGVIGFVEAMAVRHTPRPITLRGVTRQAQWARDDLALYALHPSLTNAFALPAKPALVVGTARFWVGCIRSGHAPVSPRRVLRAIIFSAVSSMAIGWTVLRTPSARALRSRYGPAVSRS